MYFFFSAKSNKVDVLNTAASFLKSLALANRAKRVARSLPTSPGSVFGIRPVSTPSTFSSPSSSDSGNSSLDFGLSPEQNRVASLMRNNAFLPTRLVSIMALNFQTST